MDVSVRIDALQRRLDEQQRELDSTRDELRRLTSGNRAVPTPTRRAWMRRAAVLSGGSLVAGVAAGVAARPAAAADGDAITAGQQTNETTGTVVFVQGTTSGHGAFTVTDTAFASMPALTEAAAVLGVAGATTTGRAGVAGVGTAYGVYGLGDDYGVFGRATGAGVIAVGGVADGTGCAGAKFGATGSGSTGLLSSGETGVHAAGTRNGVVAAGGSGAGVSASGARGGHFTGTAAAVNLAPTAHASHPRSGSAGDLVVDRHHRLWFCKGGTNWKQLA